MESRLIYESDKTYQNKIQWISPIGSESEWRYLNPQSANEIQLQNIINKKFIEETLYLVIDRNESMEIDKLDLGSKIKGLYGKTEFKVWDKSFQNIIEFNLEVYREGINASR